MERCCYKCQTECVFKEDKLKTFGFPCDMCCLVVCQNCNKTQAQEIRVIPSQTRTLVFLCPDCLSHFKNLSDTLKEVKALRNELSLMKKNFECMETSLEQSNLTIRVEALEKGIMGRNVQPSNEDEVESEKELQSKELVGPHISAVRDVSEMIKEQFTIQQEQIAIKLDSVVNAIKDTNIELVKIITDLNPASSNHNHKEVHQNPRKKPVLLAADTNSSNDRNSANGTKYFSNVPVNQSNSQGKGMAVKGTSKKQLSISAAENRKWIYIGNLSGDCSEEMIKTHMSDNHINTLSCQKMQTKHDHVASFKVSVPADSEHSVLNSEMWPTGVVIKPFFFPSGKRNQYRSRNFQRRSINQSRT